MTNIIKEDSKIILSLHQPNFIPWIGFFYKIAKSDIFVFIDEVQFIKRSYINRVKIKTVTGTKWMTVPVKTKGRYYQKINEVEIDNERDWKKKILGLIKMNYSKSPFYEKYFYHLNDYLMRDYHLLTEFNIGIIKWLLSELSIKTKIYKSSEIIEEVDDPTERIIKICKKFNAEIYLSGFGGNNYQEVDVFKKSIIEPIVYDFKHPVYSQLWDDFVSGLSIIDYLFNTDIKEIKEFINDL